MSTLNDSIGQIHLINLDRSGKRLTRFHRRNTHLQGVVRFSAVDGASIDKGQLIREGLIRNDVEYGPGTLGCALSHIKLWQHAAATDKPVTIAEDDTLFSMHFSEMAQALLQELGDGWDFIHWGYDFEKCYVWLDFGFARARLDFYGLDRSPERRLFLQSTRSFPRAMRLAHSLGLFCYSVTPNGARALLNYCVPLRQRNITLPGTGEFLPDLGTDVAMAGAYESMNAFASMPPIVFCDYSESDRSAIDSMG